MEYKIEFLGVGSPADVVITLSGELTPKEFREATDELAQAPQWRTGLTLLIDISALDVGQISDEAVGKLSEPVVQRDWDFPPKAIAIVAPEDAHFRAARAYRAHLGGSNSRRNVVRTRADAIAWLSLKR